MNTRGRPYIIAFVIAAGLHAGLIFAWGRVFETRAEFAMAAGKSVELLLVESAGEPPAEEMVEPALELPLPAPDPIREPLPELPPPEPVPAPIAEMIEPEPEAVPPPKTASRPREQSASAAQPKPVRATASRPVGKPGAGTPAGVRTQAKPDYLSNPPPPYPASSRQSGEQGVVMLTVSVTEQGRAAAVRLRRSSGFPRLDAAARSAVQRWRFSPAKIGGIAVATEVEVPVRFQLK